MIKNSDLSNQEFSTAVWPLGRGALPPLLFDAEHLYDIIFHCFPYVSKFTLSTIRQSLKSHLKRNAPGYRLSGSDQKGRDTSLVFSFGNISASRERASELVFIVSQNGHGRAQSVGNYKPKQSFENIIWSCYEQKDELRDLVEWMKQGAEKNELYGKGVFHNSHTFLKAIKAGDCPVSIDDVWLSRSIVLFSSLLPREDCLDLLKAAADQGCQPIIDTYFSVTISSSAEESSSGQPVYEDSALQKHRSPKFPVLKETTFRSWEASEDIQKQATALLQAEQTMRESRNSADTIVQPMITFLLDCPHDKWLSIVDVIERARDAISNFATLQAACRKQCKDHLVGLLSRLKTSVPSVFPEIDGTTEKLVTALRDIDAINSAFTEVLPSPAVIASWRTDLSEHTTISALWKLVHMAQKEAIDKERRHKFYEEVSEYCKKANKDEIENFLVSQDVLALFAIIAHLCADPWVPAAAILLSVALTNATELPCDVLLSIMPSSSAGRRAFFRFVDPNSSIFYGKHNVQRLIIVERLRDAWTFGPLAQISDLASGAGHVELVGRRVSDLVDLIISNLDILSNGADLVRMLRPLCRDESQERLVNFIETPPTLKGNFRRLREIAREQLLLPLLASQSLCSVNVEKIVAIIKSGDAADRIVAEFNEARPDDRLEARHHDQLARYLDQANQFLSDFLMETGKKPDARQRKFINTLREIRDGLKTEGELGSIEWLEAEIRAMLDGKSGVGAEQPTLIGDGTSMLSRYWDAADSDWASSFINLPEFHGEITPRPIEVAASILHWKSRNLLPGPGDIAHYLVKQKNFSEALQVAADASDLATEEFVRKSCSTRIAALQARGDAILLEFRQYSDYSVLGREDFDAALARLKIKDAEEILELWELSLKEEEKKAANKIEAAAEKERKEALFILLQNAGASGFDDTMSTVKLAAIWQEVLEVRKQERAHLEAVSSEFQKCETILPDLVERIVRFNEDVTDPKLWLSASLASDLVVPVNAIASKVSNWVMNSPNFRNEEKSAVIALVGWFLDFVIERSVSLHEGNNTDIVSELDHILDISVTITDAVKPSDCLARLTDSGEMDTFDIDTGTETNYVDVESKRFREALDLERPYERNILEDDMSFPRYLLETVKNQNWQAAVEFCDTAAKDANSEQALQLFAIKRAITPFMDCSPVPSDELSDMFPASAAWLSSQSDGVSQLSDSVMAELAYRLLSGAVAVDSCQEMSRSPSKDGMWTDLLRASSPFRRMLTTSLPMLTGKVVEALISGQRGLVVAEKLWDAATNQSEPQIYRAPLLSLLNDNGAQEIIIKLAERHDSAIVSRLSQLFELRAVAQNRPDLLPVAQSVAEQVALQAKAGPFRVFVKSLPSAAQFPNPTLSVVVQEVVQLRELNENKAPLEIPIVITPEGLVPAVLHAQLFEEDDVTFEDDSCVKILSNNPIYFTSDYNVALRFGPSWFGRDTARRDSVRIRIQAKTVTNDLFQQDVLCIVRPIDRNCGPRRKIDTDTLLEIYPGVANTPVVNKEFIGRIDELERLQQVLVSAHNPSPVLLTGMRRIGKTSLLYAFHQRFSGSNGGRAVSIYQSLAERRVEFASLDQSVSKTFFKAIARSLVRPNVPAHDRNYSLCRRIREHFGNDWREARKAIFDCYDEESLSDSLVLLADRLREWCGWDSRFIFLIDEAEALVAAYQAGGRKKLELEQLLQSLREVSQNTGGIGLLLSGSNHINMFAREYKNAFFGSSQTIELEGFSSPEISRLVVAPNRIETYIKFEESAISYAWELCAGMPQFLWQIGATTSFRIKSGIATRNDIRSAVAMLVSPNRTQLPFKPYEMLEPIDSMLSLEATRERDLLWMLLFRIAQASSLAAPDAAIPVAIDQSLLAADDQTGWRRRLRTLIDLKTLRMDSTSTVRFQVPLFAESFRSPKNLQEFNIRQQQVAI